MNDISRNTRVELVERLEAFLRQVEDPDAVRHHLTISPAEARMALSALTQGTALNDEQLKALEANAFYDEDEKPWVMLDAVRAISVPQDELVGLREAMKEVQRMAKEDRQGAILEVATQALRGSLPQNR